MSMRADDYGYGWPSPYVTPYWPDSPHWPNRPRQEPPARPPSREEQQRQIETIIKAYVQSRADGEQSTTAGFLKQIAGRLKAIEAALGIESEAEPDFIPIA